MRYPRITLVTPSYNQGDFLEATIRSVLEQDYPNLEYIVLDGGSTDESLDIIKRYSSYITHWRSERDGGQSAALREGFDLASGEILNWLNSDDMLAQGALHRVAEAWHQHGPEIVIAGGCQVLSQSAGPAHYPGFQHAMNQPGPLPLQRMLDLRRHWFPGEFFYQPEVFFPSAAYRAVGGIDPSIYYTMDYDLYLKLAIHDVRVVTVPHVLAFFREHDAQKTAQQKAVRRQAVSMANAYLRRAPLSMSRAARARLMVSNSLSLLPMRRRP